jgi:hypothetical protein
VAFREVVGDVEGCGFFEHEVTNVRNGPSLKYATIIRLELAEQNKSLVFSINQHHPQ